MNNKANNMKTYSSVKEAIRSGIAFSSTTVPRRHTLPYNSSYTDATTTSSSSQSNSNSTSSSPSHSSYNNTFEICLNPENIAPETLDISQYTYQDLQDLKKSDPFFYYSIPEIHLRSYGCTRHHLNGSGAPGAGGGQGSAAMEEEGVDEAVEEEQQEEEQGGKDSAQKQEQEDDQGGGDQPRRRRRSSNDYRRASLPPNFLQHSRQHRDNNHKHQLHIPIHQGQVTKSRRLSVEAHPSLIVESMMLYEEEEEGTDNDNILGNHLGDVNLNDDSDDDDDSDDMEEEMLLRILGGDCTLMPEITGEEEDDTES